MSRPTAPPTARPPDRSPARSPYHLSALRSPAGSPTRPLARPPARPTVNQTKQYLLDRPPALRLHAKQHTSINHTLLYLIHTYPMWSQECGAVRWEYAMTMCVYCLSLAGRVSFSTRAPVQSLTIANSEGHRPVF